MCSTTATTTTATKSAATKQKLSPQQQPGSIFGNNVLPFLKSRMNGEGTKLMREGFSPSKRKKKQTRSRMFLLASIFPPPSLRFLAACPQEKKLSVATVSDIDDHINPILSLHNVAFFSCCRRSQPSKSAARESRRWFKASHARTHMHTHTHTHLR